LGMGPAEIQEHFDQMKAELLARIPSEPFFNSDNDEVNPLQEMWAKEMRMLKEDLPELLRREPNWDAFADDMTVELAGETLRGKDHFKKVVGWLSEKRRNLTVTDEIFISFDPMLDAFLTVFPNRKPIPRAQMGVKLDAVVLPFPLNVEAQITLHFNDKFQVSRVQIQKCIINRQMLHRMVDLPKKLLGEDWTHSFDNMFDPIKARLNETPEEEVERLRLEAYEAQLQEQERLSLREWQRKTLQEEKRKDEMLDAKLEARPAGTRAEAEAKIQVKVDEIRVKKKKLEDEGVKRREFGKDLELQKLTAELKALKEAAEESPQPQPQAAAANLEESLADADLESLADQFLQFLGGDMAPEAPSADKMPMAR